MSIESELHCIEVELQLIKDSKERIEAYVEELNKHNPFSVGDVLIGNDYSHRGKEFVVDKVSTSYSHRSERLPRVFMAEGAIKLKSGELGLQRTHRTFEITRK